MRGLNTDSAFFLLCFLPALGLLYYLLPGERVRNGLLLVGSLAFCAFGRISGLILLTAFALVNWLLGLGASRGGKEGRAFAVLGIVLDLAFLCAFKYLDFLLAPLLPGAAAAWKGLGLAAPLGVSFFTFKAVSYLIDTGREPDKVCRNPLHVLLYLSFFPQLAAGPITRCGEFVPQLRNRGRSGEDLALGLRRFILGLALVFAQPLLYGVPDRLTLLVELFLAALLGGGLLWLVRIAGGWIFKREALGLGDVHLMFMLAPFLNWPRILLTIFLASIIGCFGGLATKALAKEKKVEIPFGPYLAAAALIAYFCGNALVKWYLGLLGK